MRSVMVEVSTDACAGWGDVQKGVPVRDAGRELDVSVMRSSQWGAGAG